MNFLFHYIAPVGLALVVLFTIAWLIQLRTKNAAIADVVWGLAFPVSAGIYFIRENASTLRSLVFLLLVTVWGLRLAVHLYLRTAGKSEDVRYTALRKEWGALQNLYMLRFFYVQAILALILSVPFLLVFRNTAERLHILEIFGFVISIVGIVGEGTADQQLKKFKSSSIQNSVCNIGLWKYSRHPNYFFEWLVWIGFFFIALPAPLGWIAALSPILMLYLLLKVTGIPYTEAHMLKTKGPAFAEYQRTTSVFVPLPKKKP